MKELIVLFIVVASVLNCAGQKVIDGILNNSGVGSDHGGDILTKEKYHRASGSWRFSSVQE